MIDIQDWKNAAIRQYRHNNSDGLVFGYDEKMVNNRIESDAAKIDKLEDRLIVQGGNIVGYQAETDRLRKVVARLGSDEPISSVRGRHWIASEYASMKEYARDAIHVTESDKST